MWTLVIIYSKLHPTYVYVHNLRTVWCAVVVTSHTSMHVLTECPEFEAALRQTFSCARHLVLGVLCNYSTSAEYVHCSESLRAALDP